jgi:hypothetical protein
MRPYLIPFVFGLAMASALFLLVVLPRERHDKFEYGRVHGGISARLDIVRRLPAAVGSDLDRSECTNKFLEVKDATIWVVERQGVKTLRVD